MSTFVHRITFDHGYADNPDQEVVDDTVREARRTATDAGLRVDDDRISVLWVEDVREELVLDPDTGVTADEPAQVPEDVLLVLIEEPPVHDVQTGRDPAAVCGSPTRRHDFPVDVAVAMSEGRADAGTCRDCGHTFTREQLLTRAEQESRGVRWWLPSRPYSARIFLVGAQLDERPLWESMVLGNLKREAAADGRAPASPPVFSWDVEENLPPERARLLMGIDDDTVDVPDRVGTVTVEVICEPA